MRVASFIDRLGSQFTHCEELWSPWMCPLDGWSLPLYLLTNGLSELVHIFSFLIYREKWSSSSAQNGGGDVQRLSYSA